MKTITICNYKKISDKKMSKEEMENYILENNLDGLHEISFLTKNNDGSFEEDYLDSEGNIFHTSTEPLNGQEFFN